MGCGSCWFGGWLLGLAFAAVSCGPCVLFADIDIVLRFIGYFSCWCLRCWLLSCCLIWVSVAVCRVLRCLASCDV